MRVIGTAGHVDHGKSTLVEALTGTHPDRLKEEREREMTIDLGFAWLVMPDGEEVGIVDVPGHRDFIENMLAGVGGIDAVLFVVASDEGVMPQTREHLAILDLLQVGGGIVALTKVDLVDDPEWLDLIEEDVRGALAGTVLASAPIIRVSARTKAGLPALIQSLEVCLAERPLRSDLGRPRLPVDRVFTMAGFGTVVTGTLIDGRLKVGDDLHILPQELRGRVRGLQTHKRKEELAIPGSRTAVNISGVNVDQIQRGDIVAHPGDYVPTRRVDVRFRLLREATSTLTHNTEVKLYIGAAEVVSHLRLLGSEVLHPGEEGWLQLDLSHPVVAVRGDRYIIRRPSPGETLGGGTVIDPHPKARHKRFAGETIARLEALSRGSSTEILFQAVSALGAAPLKDVFARSNLDDQAAFKALEELLTTNQVIDLEAKADAIPIPSSDILVISKSQWDQLATHAIREVENYHRAYPLRRGIPREELKSRLKSSLKGDFSGRLYQAMLRRLVNEAILEESGTLVSRKGHSIKFQPQQQHQAERLMERFAASPYSPPTIKECLTEVGDEVYNGLLDLGWLVAVSSEVVFRREDYEILVKEVRNLIIANGPVTAAQVRDHLNTSRRYVLALLEDMDVKGVTVRKGDVRKLKPG